MDSQLASPLMSLLAVYGAFILGLISPGPDFVLVSALAVGRGAKQAWLAACGIALGVGLWVFAAAAGLGVVIAASPQLWEALRFVAGGVLIYMGARALSAAVRDAGEDISEDSGKREIPPLALGFLTNLANPKAALVLVGLTAMLAEVTPNRTMLMASILGMPLLALTWFSMLATLLTRPVVKDRLVSNRRALNGAMGIALAAVGVLLIQTPGPG